MVGRVAEFFHPTAHVRGRAIPAAQSAAARRSKPVHSRPIRPLCLTGGSADLAEVLVVEDHDQSRCKIRARSPEMNLREGTSDTLLDEIIGSDRIACQTSRVPPKVR